MSTALPVLGWIELLPLHDVARGESKYVEAEGVRLLVHHTREGELFVTSAQCPHEDFTMERCALRGTVITCIEHGWEMDVRTGEVVAIGDDDARLPTYRAELRDGRVFAKVF
jgi:toluene monooxygenase system ferredoxin subunit